jgi:hypothetical protein
LEQTSCGQIASVDEGKQPPGRPLTVEEVDHRIERLRGVFAQGFLSKDEFERVKRHILERSQRARAASGRG